MEEIDGTVAAPGALSASERAERELRPLPADPRIAVAITTDGRREYIPQALDSLFENVRCNLVRLVVADDSGDPEYAEYLRDLLEPRGGELIHHPERRGQTVTINDAWGAIDAAEIDYIIHLEDDFIFNRPIDVREWAYPLTVDPALAQVTLLRQPWSQEEINAGSVLAMRPDYYTQRSWGGVDWLEHRVGYFANPHIAPAWVADLAWPPDQSEYGFSGLLLHPPAEAPIPHGVRFAYLGRLEDEPLITHIGVQRSSEQWSW